MRVKEICESCEHDKLFRNLSARNNFDWKWDFRYGWQYKQIDWVNFTCCQDDDCSFLLEHMMAAQDAK